MADYFLPLSRKKTKRDSDNLHSLLSEWSGKEIADNEIIPKLPPTQHISQGMEDAVKSLLPANMAVFQKIKHDWNEIAGNQLAQYMTPANMHDGVLYIEVSHPAWLMEFKTPQQDMLLDKIHKHTGSKHCKKIKLVPSGKNARRKN
jgi:predicted nucleic acid-binding Zn ribbon protein